MDLAQPQILQGSNAVLIVSSHHNLIRDGLVVWGDMPEGSGSTTRDASGRGHTLTLTNMDEADWVAGPPQIGGWALNFDGSSGYARTPHASDLSFGNSTSDYPFSVTAMIHMDVSTRFRIVSKGRYIEVREWVFTTLADEDRLSLYLYDLTNSHNQWCKTSDTLTAHKGTWLAVGTSYDGRGGAAAYDGIKLYVAGAATETICGSTGSYTAMHNTGEPVDVGVFAIGSSPTYADGRIAALRIYNRVLNAAEFAAIAAGRG